jgi:hypothetical protein
MTAAKKLALATYRYNDLDDGVKQLERRYVPKDVRDKAAALGIILKAVTEKQISYQWSF